MDVQTAARDALATHDALREVRQQEPPSDDEGMPIDGQAWKRWYDTIQKPAYAEWDAAMDALADALGESDMSRHPINFVPRCKAIIAGTEPAAMREP